MSFVLIFLILIGIGEMSSGADTDPLPGRLSGPFWGTCAIGHFWKAGTDPVSPFQSFPNSTPPKSLPSVCVALSKERKLFSFHHCLQVIVRSWGGALALTCHRCWGGEFSSKQLFLFLAPMSLVFMHWRPSDPFSQLHMTVVPAVWPAISVAPRTLGTYTRWGKGGLPL